MKLDFFSLPAAGDREKRDDPRRAARDTEALGYHAVFQRLLTAALALGLCCVPHSTRSFGFIAPGRAETAPLTKQQSDALSRYDQALNEFKSILSRRRAQIVARQPLPNRSACRLDSWRRTT